MKKIVCCMLSVLMLVSLLSVMAFATARQQIIIDYDTDDGPLSDVEFSVYRLGDVDGKRIIPDSSFSSYSVSFDISDAEKISSLALTLSAYTLRDKITPDHTDRTDENGVADFDGEYFEAGAYLYLGEKHFQYDNIYFCDAAIIILPYGEGDSVVSKPKYEVTPDDPESVTVSYKILKSWYEDDPGKRPVYIEVQLLRDGEVYDTVVLDDSNNWRYQWTGLSSRYHWIVTEKIVAQGYLVSLSKNEKTYLMSNSTSDDEESTIPIESTTFNDPPTEPVSTTLPDDSTTSVVTTSADDDGDELPQTGALKWPVPYLACIGLILIIAGFVTYRKSELADEQE